MLERVQLAIALPFVVEVQLNLGDQWGKQLPNLRRLGILEGVAQVSSTRAASSTFWSSRALEPVSACPVASSWAFKRSLSTRSLSSLA